MHKVFVFIFLVLFATTQSSCNLIGKTKLEKALDNVEIKSYEASKCSLSALLQAPTIDDFFRENFPNYVPFQEKPPTDYWAPDFEQRDLEYYQGFAEHLKSIYGDSAENFNMLLSYKTARENFTSQVCFESRKKLGDSADTAYKLGATSAQVKGAFSLGHNRVLRERR